MAEFELSRTKDDRRLYELGALGSLRLEGLLSRRARAMSAGVTWQFEPSAGRGMRALASQGRVVGEFDPHSGELQWNGQMFQVRLASSQQERQALAVGETEVALFEDRSWGSHPVKVEIVEPAAIEPGLMLFAAFVLRSAEQR